MSSLPIKNVAIFGASGTLGAPITAAVLKAGFDVTVISRADSQSTFPDEIPVIKTEYTVDKLRDALTGQDAVVCAVGQSGIPSQTAMIDAAAAAGVGRFVLDDFGYPPEFQRLPELVANGESRRKVLEYAKRIAEREEGFTWSAVAIGVPIDWALKRFPTFGFDGSKKEAIIYDSGNERFTGTTLRGIAQAVVGILRCPEETSNRHLCVRSIETCQNEILKELERQTGEQWRVKRESSIDLLKRGRERHGRGERGWVLDLIVGQLLEEGSGRGVVVTREGSDNALLGVQEETVAEMVEGMLALNI